MPQKRIPTDPNRRADKESGQYRNWCRQLKKQKEQPEGPQNFLETLTVAPTTLSQSTKKIIETVIQPKESQKWFIYPMRHVGKQNIPKRNATLEPMQPIDRLPDTEGRKDRIRSNKETIRRAQLIVLKLQPQL